MPLMLEPSLQEGHKEVDEVSPCTSQHIEDIGQASTPAGESVIPPDTKAALATWLWAGSIPGSYTTSTPRLTWGCLMWLGHMPIHN